ncbi:MAG: dihydrolipoyl dehydrogenase [Actinobacteria bacterium]|nr:dihydrolipoyl dehydrogenase [Actinomycetota bacterium]
METKTYDLAVIGGGTGGYSAAIRASELGMKVALVERDGLGGTCLLRGCIPSKALLYAAKLVSLGKVAADFGISYAKPSVDWASTQSAKSEVVNRLTRGLEGLLIRRKIEIVKGSGRLIGTGRVHISPAGGGEREIAADNIVIATGSAPRIPAGVDIDGRRIFTSDELLNIDYIPSSMVIIGGGFIGCEFASMFNSFGTDVTLIELLPELLAREDREVKERLVPAFEKRGIKLHLDTTVAKIGPLEDGVVVELADKPAVKAEALLVATGRRPVTEEVGLEAVGTKTERGFVPVDEDYLAVPGVYAIGDCIATLALAHAAFAEGYYVAEKIGGGIPLRPDYDGIPRVTYSFPEVASVGITEDEAVGRGLDIEVARFPFQANSRAVTMKNGEGFAKIIALKGGGPIIGVHLIGGEVSELITEGMLAVNWEASAAEVGILHHPHPTLSEAIGEAALKLAGMPLHSP